MKIDTEHLHHWMRAIRESKDPIRTMDAFWRGQMLSKEWLIGELKKQKKHFKSFPSIDIHGGWVGTLASLLFQSDLYISHINSIDIDPSCQDIALTMNQLEMEAGKFRAITADMCSFKSSADIVINTSCEHITQDQYNSWLSNMSKEQVLILQSNNYKLPEHIRTAENLEEFKTQCGNIDILWAGELKLSLYTRFMIIARPN